jgi:hypothetical protein
MENRLSLENDLLVCIEPVVEEKYRSEYLYLKANFCGRVLDTAEKVPDTLDLSTVGPHSTIYACGNVRLLCDKVKSLLDYVKVIRELSYNYEVESRLEIVSLGEVSVPAFIMEFFNKDTDVGLVRCRSIYTKQQSTIVTA